jgi:hypothetical protein
LRRRISLFLVIFLIIVILAATQSVKSSETVNAFETNPLTSSASPAAEFNQTYGNGSANALIKSADGGYVMAGTINSTGADYSGFVGNVSLVKTDSSGNIQWNRTYNRVGLNDVVYSVIQTTDGGYVIVGCTMTSSIGIWDYSNFGGPGSGVFHVTLTRPSAFLIKTDPTGNKTWNKSYYYNSTSYTIINATGRYTTIINYAVSGYSVVEADNGDYVIVGSTNYFASGNHLEVLFFKTSQNGTALFDQAYSGIGADVGYSIVKTSDGNYAIVGYRTSSTGNRDVYLIKTNTNGDMIWNKTYGDLGYDIGNSLIQTTDGGYLVAGSTNSSGEGNSDFWAAKLDINGNMQWNKTYGGAGSDSASSVIQVVDGGYAIAGTTNSFGAGNTDAWLVKTDAYGNAQWNKTIGGPFDDGAKSVVQANDGGFALAGYTNSSVYYNFWLVKLAAASYVLSVSSPHGNPVPAVGVYNYNSGTSITASVPSSVTEGNTVWTCTGWTGTGSVSSGNGTSTTFTINQDSSITWNWQGTPVQYMISASASENGAISPSGSVNVSAGGSRSFSIIANTGYHIVDVVVNGVSQGAVASYDFVNVVAVHSITASFAINTYTLMVTQGANGVIAPGTTNVNYGSNNTFSVTPAPGYHIVDVVVDDVSQGVIPTYTFSNVVSVHMITATFAIDTYPLTIAQGANGMITPGTTTVNYGGTQSFTITPNNGYYIASITTNSGSVTVTSPSGQTVSFSNVVAANTVTATFALTPTTTTNSTSNPTPNNPTPTPKPIVTTAPTIAPSPTSSPTTSSSPTPTVPELPLSTILPLLTVLAVSVAVALVLTKKMKNKM